MQSPSVLPVAKPRLYFPPRKKWTRKEYDRLTKAGIFTPEDKIELLEGEIVQKMPQNSPHVTGIYLTQKALERVFGEGYYVRAQAPLALGLFSEPEPDIAVVIGAYYDYLDAQPTTALLVVEVSDTTLRVDRITKASIYARAGIPEYVILNVRRRCLEVHRNPGPMASKPLGYGYAEKTILDRAANYVPLAVPEAKIPVASLLPERPTTRR